MFIGNVMSGDAGHNCLPDVGATGIKQEDNLTRELWAILQAKFRALGYTVTDCTPYNQRFQGLDGSLGYRCRVANQSGSKFHLCIHFNKTLGGHGVEAYVTSPDGAQYGKQLCDTISTLGFANRGVKDGSHLFVVNHTNMPCVLLECCFVDSQEDMNRYNPEVFANTIIKALTGKEVGKVKPVLKYQGHAQSIGWQSAVNEGETAGTEGKGLRLESLLLDISSGNIQIEGHVQGIGWQSPRYNGEPVGSIGLGLRLEAVKIKLLGLDGFSVQYQVHVEGIGWMPWVSDGQVAGTVGQAKRIEAIRIRIVSK